VVSPVDHCKFDPEVVNTEFAQLFVTVTIGADGATIGFADAVAGELVHPPTVCVTVYVPALVTVIEVVVAPVDHNKLVPVAVRTELPHPSTPETDGAEGIVFGAAVIEASELVHPPTVCVTVYVPALVTVIEAVVAPVDHNRFVPVAVNTELPHPSTPETVGAAGIVFGAAVTEAGALVHPPTVWVTVYVPADVTVIDAVVAPVDHSKLDPVADNTELPQLFVTVVTGAEGAAIGFAETVAGKLVHPPTVCVTV
jgi:hypothetical protein